MVLTRHPVTSRAQHPTRSQPGWVGRLIKEADVKGISMVVDADKVECDAELDGETMHMTWAVSIARRDA